MLYEDALVGDSRSLAPDVPTDIADLVARCLEKEPDRRPSAAELAGALGRIADGLGMASLPALEMESELFNLDAKAAERAATVVGVPGLARG